MIKAQNEVELIGAELKKLLGLSMEESIALKDSFLYIPVAVNEKEFLQVAYLNKPEMQLAALGVDMNKWSIEMAKAGG